MSPLPLGYTAPLMSATKVRIFFEFSISCEEIEYEEIVVEEMERLKADMKIMAQGALSLSKLQDGDKILIAESCSHHPTHDDIGRVKIPMLIKKKTGKNLIFEFFAGSDFPQNLKEYKLVIQCGSCMLNRRETLSRVQKSVDAGIPITNYGMVISACQGVFDRVMEIFLSAN